MAISHLFPEEGPTLNLNFAGSRTLDPRITFTRTQTTSNGSTYMGRDGLVKYAGPDEPRFHHRYVNGEVESLGLLIEEQRVNYFTESIISNWGTPIQGTKTGSAGISPDGTNTATLIEATSDNNQTRIENGGDRVPGQTYTMSCFCKAGTTEYCTFGLYETTTGVAKNFQAIFYLVGDGDVTYEVNNTATITPFPNGWYKCTMTITLSAGASYSGSGWKLGVCDNPTLFYNVGTGDNVYFWGAQLEQGSFPTSYIPTEGSTKTRTKDVAYIDGSNFTEWYNQSEGTFFTAFRQIYDASATDPSSTKHVIQAGNDVTVNDNYTIRAGQNSTSWTALIRSSSPSSLQFPGISGFGYLNSSTLYKAALSVDISLISVSLNGLLSADITNTTTVNHSTQFNKLFIGSGSGGSPPYELCGTIAQITYYPTRLSNSQLVALTR